jgi:signal transduction histidine kinase
MQPVYKSYQQIQQFTADAAHELRTPLAAIQATTESVNQSYAKIPSLSLRQEIPLKPSIARIKGYPNW